MKVPASLGSAHRAYRTIPRGARVRAVLAGIGLLGATAGMGVAFAPAAAAASCTPTGFMQDGMNLTAAEVNPGDLTNMSVDAAGCNIGVYFSPGDNGSVSGVTIAGAPNYYGILVNGASVDVTDSAVNDIGESPHNGAQHGVGIAYRDGASGTISGNTVTNYQKNGIVVTGPTGSAPSTASVLDNTVTGDGQVDYIAQNGIQISYGSSATVTGNTISGNFYTPKTYVACGLLYYEANGVRASRNHYSGNEINVCNFGQRGGGNVTS